MTAARVKTVLALAVIAVSAAALFLTFRPSPPMPNLKPHQGLGAALAREAAKLVGPGGKVTIIALDTDAMPNACAEAQLDSFLSAAKSAGLTVSDKSLVKLDPLRLVRPPPAPFLERFRKGNDADVVVSFLGPPPVTLQQRAKMPEKLPKVVAVCSGETPRQTHLKPLFDAGMLHAVIIDRPGASSSGAAATPSFESLYQLVNTANLGDLPAPSTRVARK